MLGILAQTTSDFTTTTTVTTTSDSGASAGVIFVIGLIFYLIFSFILSVVFKKAGRKAWEAYVPIYNTWVTLEIAGKPGWWILINLIPFVGGLIFFVLYIIATIELAKRFGKGPLFAIFGLVLFSLVGMSILAFGKSTYSSPGSLGSAQGPQPSSPFGGGNTAAPQTNPEAPAANVSADQFSSVSNSQSTAPSQPVDASSVATAPQQPLPAQEPEQPDPENNPPASPPTPPANPVV